MHVLQQYTLALIATPCHVALEDAQAMLRAMNLPSYLPKLKKMHYSYSLDV
jgi:hypothetical protein